METMIVPPTGRIINRLEGLTARAGAGADRSVCPSRLTSGDIETEALVRLARQGYDWSGTPERRRRAP